MGYRAGFQVHRFLHHRGGALAAERGLDLATLDLEQQDRLYEEV